MSLGERIFGVETEFGCLVRDDSLGPAEHVVDAVKNHVFYRSKMGAIDVVARSEAFEPARSGGFLINGGRLYVDAVGSHEEYATAECRDLRSLIAQDKAGHRILLNAVQDLGWQDKVSFYNNSVDHFGGHTFGCHENYLVEMDDSFFGEPIGLLYPFLVTRQIFAGVGRVGGHKLDRSRAGIDARTVLDNPLDYVWVPHVYSVVPDPSVEYQLSQRADHIVRATATRVRFNRAIINPKWDDFFSFNRMTRLHILYGESNMSDYAYALKVGTTSLLLDLLEDMLIPPDLRFEGEADVVMALRAVSRGKVSRWAVEMAEGRRVPAIELQRRYLRLASDNYRGRDGPTDWVLAQWEEVLDGLETDPMSLADRLDWVAKLKVLETYREELGADWGDDALHSVDMEYHNIDPNQGLYHALVRMNRMRRLVSETDILDAVTDPPNDTRAHGRSQVIRALLSRRSRRYWVDWDMVAVEGGKQIVFRDPFWDYGRQAREFTAALRGAS